jgi:fluoride exporter
MQGVLVVGLGGFLGSIARYKLGGLVLHMTAEGRFPHGTLTVNVLGCLIVGILAGVAEQYDVLGPDTRLFLFAGLLGGFTTFSAFGLEAIYLIRRGDLGIAALYAGSSVVLGITAVWLGLKLISLIPR